MAARCRNPRCSEEFRPAWEGGGWTRLCPSCRLAGRWGVYLAFAVMAIWKLATWILGT